jgi:LemA protein
MDQLTLCVTIALFSIVFLAVFNVCYTFFRIIRQTQSAIKDIERQFREKVEIFSHVIGEVIRYVAFEKALAEEIKTVMRKAGAAKTVEEKEEAGDLMSDVLKSIFKVSEKYPELKFSQRLNDLKNQLAELEEGIKNSKKLYRKGKNVLKNIIDKLPFSFSGLGKKAKNPAETAVADDEDQKPKPKAKKSSKKIIIAEKGDKVNKKVNKK